MQQVVRGRAAGQASRHGRCISTLSMSCPTISLSESMLGGQLEVFVEEIEAIAKSGDIILFQEHLNPTLF